jgi:hypothetical protein
MGDISLEATVLFEELLPDFVEFVDYWVVIHWQFLDQLVG